MDVIRFSNDGVMNFLGGSQRRVKEFKYRLNKFVIKADYPDEREIWYNVFTGMIVVLRDLQINNLLKYDGVFCDYEEALIQNYFFVPEDFNEEELMQEFRKRQSIPITPNLLTRLNSFTILTTTQCNARCFYCYQLGHKHKKSMTKETAEEVAKYIIDRTFDQSVVSLGWFGGEPLYNKEVIDIITNKVEATGRKVQAGIISNSYLFNEDICKKAVRDWHISNVQVTLDGTEEVYNKAKNYIYKDDPSPFKTIIKNIHHMINYGLEVSIRLNVGTHNCEDLKNLIKFLGKEFGQYPNVTAYVHELFDDEGTRAPEDSKKIFDNMKELEDLIFENNLKSAGFDLHSGIKSIHCMVDDGSSIIIMPDGRLGLCEHYETDHFVGDISEPTKIDIEEVKAWREMSDYKEICDDCPYKPACLKCKLCPDYKICDPWEKEYKLKRIQEDLRFAYEDWLKQFNNNNNNSCNNGTCK